MGRRGKAHKHGNPEGRESDSLGNDSAMATRVLMECIEANIDTARLFSRLIRATLEYVQFLNNDHQRALRLHTLAIAVQETPKTQAVPHHEQCKQLGQIQEAYERLADTIEKDSSGNWGDIFADECRTEYMRRKISFETAMDSEWRAAHAEINLIDVKYSWNL